MLGKKDRNYPEFDRAEEKLTSMGYVAVNPAVHSRSLRATRQAEIPRSQLMFWDFSRILECNAIALLPGWEESDGARAERFVAETVGKKVFEFSNDLETLREAKPWHADVRARPEREFECIVGLSGYAQTGKDSTADVLVAEYGFEKVSFADPLREALLELNPYIESLPCGKGWLKALVEERGWDEVKVSFPEVRRLLQRMGTEVGRKLIHEDVWVDLAMKHMADRCLQRVVVADCRWANEAKSVHMADGKVIRVHRPDYGPANSHPSETALDEWPFDAHVENDGTLDDLEIKVKTLATQLGF
jgi:hypothetical protein